MKKILTLAAVLMTTIALLAQEKKDVTKFLGIPVDGYKSEMISKLKAKGFTSTSYDKNILEGEFNGKDVHIHVVTNNNKVYRIHLVDKNYTTETSIRIRFNTLISQFENNSKYIGDSNKPISEDEDLGYEIRVKDKRYEAIFYQVDTTATKKELERVLEKKYGVKKVEDLPEDKKMEASKYIQNYAYDLFSSALNRQVWFMIDERYGEYRILMYYDNKLNEANGEDL